MILLDTDVVSVFLRDEFASVARHIVTVHPDHCHTTSITIGEILFGLERAPSSLARLRGALEERVIEPIKVLPFDLEAARHYARIRCFLEKTGMRLDDADLRIAAIALANDLTLITGNVKHFERVPGLRVENWLE